MGSHTWEDRCPYCEFEKMLVSSYDNLHFEEICPVCGYERWTQEKIPQPEDVEFAKRTIIELSEEEMEDFVESYHEDHIAFIMRLKDSPNH